MQQRSAIRRRVMVPLVVASTVGLMTACASTPQRTQLYYWDEAYPASVYQYTKQEADATEHVSKLEQVKLNADNANRQLPPGFLAHLALLHTQLGNEAVSRDYLMQEARLYPEAQHFVQFLITQPQATAQPAGRGASTSQTQGATP